VVRGLYLEPARQVATERVNQKEFPFGFDTGAFRKVVAQRAFRKKVGEEPGGRVCVGRVSRIRLPTASLNDRLRVGRF
jgi:hypothetical protein